MKKPEKKDAPVHGWRLISPRLSQKRAKAGRKGGLATLERYGREQLAEWGRKGGRPRLLTLEEIEAQQRSEDSSSSRIAEGGK